MERMELISKIHDNKLSVIVKPNSPKIEISGWDDEKKAFRVSLNAEPEKGKANQELVKFFRKLLKREVRVVHGLKSRKKVLEFV